MLDCVTYMQDEFVGWLLSEITRQGWPQAEFARRAGLSPATVSRVLSGENRPGDDFIAGTARAFGLPPEEVMRRAGKLPDYGEVLPEAREWSARLRALSDEARVRAVRAIGELLALYEGAEGPRRRQ